jgi:crotonobetainyl-CoA:carnitine CoA-transferase CaiB-like acyl-CoA transferase
MILTSKLGAVLFKYRIRRSDQSECSVRQSFPKTPRKIRHAGPKLGEYNEEIYVRELGYNKRDLERLKSERII